MALALSLGRRGLGRTAPNPAVGCVIAKGAQVLGRGWTQPGGRPHAEPVALAQAGAAAKGATAYVTLEPCAHEGQTPPCARTLVEAGIGRVVYACEDPDPRVSGGGGEILRQAGVIVEAGLMADAAARDHAGFFLRLSEGRPMVTLKLATSFDGRIATGSGHSQWITGPSARRLTHALRAQHDAVMVGAGTARADDPALTVRGLGTAWQPMRVVLSRRLDLPLMGQLARSAGDVPLILCHGRDADRTLVETWQGLGATLLQCETRGAHIDPLDALKRLAETGITRVFCEGGGALAATLLEARLVDRLVGFTAGLAIGAEGLPAIGALGLSTLDEAERFRLVETRRVGGEVLHEWEADQEV